MFLPLQLQLRPQAFIHAEPFLGPVLQLVFLAVYADAVVIKVELGEIIGAAGMEGGSDDDRAAAVVLFP